MADSNLAPNSTAQSDDRQESSTRRDRVLPGSVSKDEYEEVDEALGKAGFRSISEGMRTLGLLFARMPELRKLVAANRHRAT